VEERCKGFITWRWTFFTTLLMDAFTGHSKRKLIKFSMFWTSLKFLRNIFTCLDLPKALTVHYIIWLEIQIYSSWIHMSRSRTFF
jgi:hypothetical protein